MPSSFLANTYTVLSGFVLVLHHVYLLKHAVKQAPKKFYIKYNKQAHNIFIVSLNLVSKGHF